MNTRPLYLQKQLDRVSRIRQQWLEENGPCVRCGSAVNLEVDHIDPSTKDPLLVAKLGSQQQNMWYWSVERRKVELAKCQVLCEECHKIKTREDRRKEVCVNGHPMTPDNTMVFRSKPNARECRTCRNSKEAVYRARKRAERDIHTAPVLVEFS